MSGAYEAEYQRWLKDPEGFWAQAAESVHWYKRCDKILDSSNAPFYRWFSGALVNTCYNLLDAHVEGLLNTIQQALFERALRFREEHTSETTSYDEVIARVTAGDAARLADTLKDAAAEWECPTVWLSGGGALEFPDDRSVWAKLDGDVEEELVDRDAAGLEVALELSARRADLVCPA